MKSLIEQSYRVATSGVNVVLSSYAVLTLLWILSLHVANDSGSTSVALALAMIKVTLNFTVLYFLTLISLSVGLRPRSIHDVLDTLQKHGPAIGKPWVTATLTIIMITAAVWIPFAVLLDGTGVNELHYVQVIAQPLALLLGLVRGTGIAVKLNCNLPRTGPPDRDCSPLTLGALLVVTQMVTHFYILEFSYDAGHAWLVPVAVGISSALTAAIVDAALRRITHYRRVPTEPRTTVKLPQHNSR